MSCPRHLQGAHRARCVSCHTSGSARATTSKPANHVQTTAPCSQCHKSTLTWAGAKYDHSAIAPGHLRDLPQRQPGYRQAGQSRSDNRLLRSMSSHQRLAAGRFQPFRDRARHLYQLSQRHPRHRQTEQCHAPGRNRLLRSVPQHHYLAGAKFNHTGITPGTCATCHNGTRATTQTERCRTPEHGFLRPVPQHHHLLRREVQSHRRRRNTGDLRDLPRHRGGAKTKVPMPHYAGSCDNCHNTTTFLGAKFDHAAVTPGTCATCHGTGGTAKTKVPVPHFSGVATFATRPRPLSRTRVTRTSRPSTDRTMPV